MTRCLCMCNDGQVRSVTLARLLRKRGQEVIAAGSSHNSQWSDETILMLCNWADVIYVMGSDSERALYQRITEMDISKVAARNITAKVDMRFSVGYDDWKVPDHPDLLRRLRDLVEADATP